MFDPWGGVPPSVSFGERQAVSLIKSREFLQVAELCLERGYYNSTANRAYYAMFHAATTALEIAGLGRETWSHSGLQSTFAADLIKRRKIYRQLLARYLYDAHRFRLRADYSQTSVSKRQARQTLRWAKEFLEDVEKVTEK
jgi:uncharacterized protein (UPF0332 family)